MTFEWLYDGLPEDGIEDHAWLRHDLADSPEQAAAKMTELYERDAGPLEDLRPHAGAPAPHFATVAVEYMRAELIVEVEEADEQATTYGRDAERIASANDLLEDLRYQKCEPDDDGASAWWRIALVHPREEPST